MDQSIKALTYGKNLGAVGLVDDQLVQVLPQLFDGFLELLLLIVRKNRCWPPFGMSNRALLEGSTR